jgi:hypothetical protein
MMRSSSYARTSPGALEGFAVLVVRLVVVIMARAYARDFDRRQRVSDQKIGLNEVERDAVVTQ